MSFNSIKKRKSDLTKQSFVNLLDYNESRTIRNGSLRLESQFESNALNFKERIARLKETLNTKSVFSEACIEDFDEDIAYIKQVNIELNTAEDLYLNNITSYQNVLFFEKQKIESKLKEIKAKLNILKSSSSVNKFIFKESFLNYYNLNNYMSNNSYLNVDVESELATLPEKSKEEVKVKSIFIGSESNGLPGNEDGEFKNVFNLLVDSDSRFEYFKYGDSKLKLELNLKLKNMDVINELIIEKTEITSSSNIEVKEIMFEQKDSNMISIKKLVNPTYQRFNINSIDGSKLKLKFLPVECKSLTIVLETKEYSIKDERKFFSIGVKKIRLNKIKYLDSGELNSSIINFPEPMNTIETKIISTPKLKSDDLSLNISNENYTKSKKVAFNQEDLEKTIINNSNDFSYKININKEKVNLNSLEEYKEISSFFEGKYSSKIFNRDLNPSNFSIPKKAKNIALLQYDLCRRSNDEEAKKVLGYINKLGVSKFILPIDLGLNFDEIKVYLSNKQITNQVFSLEDVTSGNDFFVENSKNLYVYSEDSLLKEIGYLLEVKKMPLIKEQEGFYISIDEEFDYSKNNIKLNSIENNIKSEVELKNNVKKFSIVENITEHQLKILENGSWRVATSEEYSINLDTGILTVEDSVKSLPKRFDYKHQDKKEIKSFEIWKKDSKIKGVYIYDKDLDIEETKEKVSLNESFLSLSKENIIKNSIVFEEGFFNNSAVEEVNFVNGNKEFKNIKKIDKDLIPAFEVINGSVSFYALNKVYLDQGFESTIKVYNDFDEEVEGLSVVVLDNSITINGISEDKIENWYISYYVLSSEEAGFRYSIDYSNGYIYFSEAIQIDNKTVYYQSGNVEVEYDICKRISNFNFNSEVGIVEVFLEEASSFNSKLKIIWEEDESNEDLEELKEYYSPLIYEVKFGVN